MGLPKVTTFLSALVIANMVGEQVRFEMKRAPTFGAVAGAVSGGLVATGITLIKAKFGI